MPEIKKDTYEYFKRSSIRGVKWTGVGEALVRLFQFSVTILLARILTPLDFGQITLALIAVKFIQLIIDFGVSSALIQKVKATSRHLNSSFTLLLTCSFFLGAFLYFEPGLVANWLGNPEIASLIKYLSLIVPLSAFNVIPRVILNRKLSFRRIAAAEFISTITYGIITGAMVLVLHNVWCFVYGVVAEQIVLGALLWIFSGWKPRFQFSWADIKDISGFSSSVFGTRILNFINLNALHVLINRFFGGAALGFFSLGYQIIDLPTQRIAKTVMKVMYPILSRVQHKPKDYESLLLNSLFVILLITLPFFTILFLLAEPFVLLFYGEKWMAAIPVLKILCLVGLLRSFWTGISVVSMSIGKPQFELYLNLGNLGLLIPGVFLLAPYGMKAVLLYFGFLLLIVFFYGQMRVLHWLNLSFKKVINEFRVPLLSSLFLVGLIYAMIYLISIEFRHLVALKFVLLTLTAVVIYSLGIFFMDRKGIMNLLKVVFKN